MSFVFIAIGCGWCNVNLCLHYKNLCLCTIRLLTRQQVSSSLRELHVWPRWFSPLSRPSPRLSSHILASPPPRLLPWLLVRFFFKLSDRETTPLYLFAVASTSPCFVFDLQMCHYWNQYRLSVSNFRYVSFCGIFSSPLPENYTAHLTGSTSAQSHPKPGQLHGAHKCSWPGTSHDPERNRRGDHLLLHRQHPSTDGRDGMCYTNCATLYFIWDTLKHGDTLQYFWIPSQTQRCSITSWHL